MIVIGGNLIIPPIYKERKYNMSKLYVKPENIIENPTAKTLKELLMNGEYIICGDLKDKNNPESLVLENVICMKKGQYVTFGISQSGEMEYFRLHDDMSIGGKMMNDFLRIFSQNYDLFLVNDNNLDKKNIYGKLGTANENKIVFRYEK